MSTLTLFIDHNKKMLSYIRFSFLIFYDVRMRMQATRIIFDIKDT